MKIDQLPSNLDTIEETLSDITPDHRTFDNIYPKEDIDNDERQLTSFKKTPYYMERDKRAESALLEKTFAICSEVDDWFGDADFVDKDPDTIPIKVLPASEIDDVFNHIDLICVTRNSITGDKTLPFAIDITYNTEPNKLASKFQKLHLYGRKTSGKNVIPNTESEFGRNWEATGRSGEKLTQTTEWPIRFKKGMKIPGFAYAKYFEDKDNSWFPVYNKGPIIVMPRFIVGYSPDLIEALAKGGPGPTFKDRFGEQAYLQRKKEFQEASEKAKWCTLLECSSQASKIQSMLENLTEEDTKWIMSDELEMAKSEIAAANNYFKNAIDAAKEQAMFYPNKKAAMEYAEEDPVCQAIIKQSTSTFLNNDWKKMAR